MQLLGGATAEAAAREPQSEEPQPRGDDRVTELETRLERLEHAFDDLLDRLDKVPERE